MSPIRPAVTVAMNRHPLGLRAFGGGLVLSLALLGGPGGAAAVPVYTTNFPANENPISQGGAWTHISPVWANVQTSGGEAFGTQVGNLSNPAAFNDSNATLTGFSPNVTITATVHLASNIADGQTHEVELLFRMAGDATHTRGYEMNFDTGGNATLVRWEGDLGSYTFINHTGGSNPEVGGLKNGDTISATVSGSNFTASVNGIQIYTATDSKWTDGQPGIGFFIRDTVAADAAFNAKFGFSSLTVTDNTPLQVVPEPATIGLVGMVLTVAGWISSRRRRSK